MSLSDLHIFDFCGVLAELGRPPDTALDVVLLGEDVARSFGVDVDAIPRPHTITTATARKAARDFRGAR